MQGAWMLNVSVDLNAGHDSVKYVMLPLLPGVCTSEC